MKRSLQAVFGIALVGLAFSGYLSYRELFASQPVQSCPSVGAPGTVFGYPACIYGFFMYLAIVVVAGIGLRRGRRSGTFGTGGLAHSSGAP
jgi:hypothetical protein